MADTTKNELSRALKHQLLTKTLDNITVRDITDECHLNRQTFYYHFHDIYELLEWTIEKEAARLVSGSRCRQSAPKTSSATGCIPMLSSVVCSVLSDQSTGRRDSSRRASETEAARKKTQAMQTRENV